MVWPDRRLSWERCAAPGALPDGRRGQTARPGGCAQPAVPDGLAKITVVRQNRVITAGCGQPPDPAGRARAQNTAHRQDEPGQGPSGGLSCSEWRGEE